MRLLPLAVLVAAVAVLAQAVVTYRIVTAPRPLRAAQSIDEGRDRALPGRDAVGVICWNDGKPC